MPHSPATTAKLLTAHNICLSATARSVPSICHDLSNSFVYIVGGKREKKRDRDRKKKKERGIRPGRDHKRRDYMMTRGDIEENGKEKVKRLDRETESLGFCIIKPVRCY